MDSLIWIWTVIICALSLWIINYHRKNSVCFKNWGIPQPREVPFLGVVGPNIIRRLHIIDLTKEIYNLNRSAKYVGMNVFATPVIMLRDLDLIKAVLVKHFDHFVDRIAPLDNDVSTLDPLMLKNLSVLTGDKWHEVRTVLSPAFTSSKMRTMFQLMSACAEKFVSNFIEQFTKADTIDMKSTLSRYSTDVIATCAFGIEVDSMKNPENEFYVYGKWVNAAGFSLILRALKFAIMTKWPSLAMLLDLKVMPTKIRKFFVDVVESTVKAREEQGINRPDMIQLIMVARKKYDLDLLDMTAQAFLFFVAGFEPVSLQMSFLAHEIAINPDIQNKLIDEINRVLEANNGQVTYEAIAEMQYLDALFQETLRRHSQMPVLDRICTKPYELPPALPGAKSFVVEPGMQIHIPLAAIHRDSIFFEEPEKFNPERFMGKKVPSGDPTNLGFGIGPRMCIGNRFAIMETKVLLFHLLKECILLPCEKTCIGLMYDRNKVSAEPKNGFWLKLKKR